MPLAHVNIGSNLGDSRANVTRAAELIAERLGVAVRYADIVVSEPWGYSSPNPFVNLGIAFDTDLAPLHLLRILRGIEADISFASHRKADGSYADRLIDIDLIAVGNTVMDTEELTLPHPRMHLRDFVLRPMARLDPEWHHPAFGLTASELLARL
ncbi:MAG: 2-amino-4-hydroxy-6-hydroxymethyldihydropteridine diphosphokinase [Paramuribaculum sp.]|nr:2-amino-4-hydroxy-6-hydroxymethyldihydropteridine diphosphokinase [Paramuribaculum sp.]